MVRGETAAAGGDGRRRSGSAARRGAVGRNPDGFRRRCSRPIPAAATGRVVPASNAGQDGPHPARRRHDVRAHRLHAECLGLRPGLAYVPRRAPRAGPASWRSTIFHPTGSWRSGRRAEDSFVDVPEPGVRIRTTDLREYQWCAEFSSASDVARNESGGSSRSQPSISGGAPSTVAAAAISAATTIVWDRVRVGRVPNARFSTLEVPHRLLASRHLHENGRTFHLEQSYETAFWASRTAAAAFLPSSINCFTRWPPF